MIKWRLLTAVACAGLVAGCSFFSKAPDVSNNSSVGSAVPSPSPSSSESPGATPTPVAAGFDPAAAPTGQDPTGAWPYFGVREGYTSYDKDSAPSSENRKYLEADSFDKIEYFDGTKLIPVEGRTAIIWAGKGDIGFYEIQKTYEKLVKDLGGVTVYEGTGQPLEDKKMNFQDGRFRGQYRIQDDQMGVYMIKTPTKQVWVQVYHPWEDNSKDYWLIVTETKPLDVKVKMIAADALKSALDASGHVAVYFNFDTDKTAIRPDDQTQIAQIVKLMTDNPTLKLSIEGHTDNAGTPDHNQTLSLGRANAVMGSLIAAGIDPGRLSAKGFGATKPIADNGSEDGKAKNRRVELVKK